MRILNEDRKILLPANTFSSPEPESKDEKDTTMAGVSENGTENQDNDEAEVMDTDGTPQPVRALRGGVDRAAERAQRQKHEEERKLKAEAAAKAPKQSRQFLKILKDIHKKQEQVTKCEEEIAVIDNDLREADCPRTRVLGKDRFWNRYYWFERNGMPYAGLPDSSTADAGFANGRLWIQGPDDLEREGYVDMKDEWQQEYVQKFGMTVPERKKIEEGTTHVFNAGQWAYIDEPDKVDQLIEWLDSRGVNEVKLQKELKLYQDKIIKHMTARTEFLKEKDLNNDEETTKRMSTRHHHSSDIKQPRCLKWHNTMAIHTLGHLHSDQPRSRKPAVVNKKKAVVEERETRSGAGKEKVPGRQGTRYEF